jgi:hypothetical protein
MINARVIARYSPGGIARRGMIVGDDDPTAPEDLVIPMTAHRLKMATWSQRSSLACLIHDEGDFWLADVA